MILLIDNFDSFTHNLVHLIGGLGEDVTVKRNNELTTEAAIGSGAEVIVISPGPGVPDQAGICLDLVKSARDARMPVFGVCLGLQVIAQGFGGRIERAGRLMHGKACSIVHQGAGLFDGVPSPFTATRYHSLVAAPESLPPELLVTATADDDNEVMAIEHQTLPLAGVQFHPESIASEHGAAIIANFLKRVRQ